MKALRRFGVSALIAVALAYGVSEVIVRAGVRHYDRTFGFRRV